MDLTLFQCVGMLPKLNRKKINQVGNLAKSRSRYLQESAHKPAGRNGWKNG